MRDHLKDFGSQLLAPVKVTGKPPHVADFVGESAAKLRLALYIAIPFWMLAVWAHQKWMRDTYSKLAASLSDDPELATYFMATVPLLVMIVAAALAVFALHRPLSIKGARLVVVAVAGATVLGEGSQVLLSYGHPNHMSSFALATFIVFSVAPITGRQRAVFGFLTLLLPALMLAISGLWWFAWMMSLPLGAALIGAVVHYRVLATFRQRRLIELQLHRRTRQAERQKEELARQKAEADRQRALAEEQHREAELQRARAMNLLASALTAPVARAYERDGFVRPFTQTVVVIFCDAVQFSDSCKHLQPERVVSEMQRMWAEFDRACLDHGLGVEPLRAEGDARMAVAGLNFGDEGTSIHQAAIAATLAMLRFRSVLPEPGGDDIYGEKVFWPMRIGINIGPVTAGVIDTNAQRQGARNIGIDSQCGRLWFDVWGDTVNMAARLAQSAGPNQILVRERMLWELGGMFSHGPVRSMKAKRDTIPDLAEILSIQPGYLGSHDEPNDRFWQIFRSESYRPVRPSREGMGPNQP